MVEASEDRAATPVDDQLRLFPVAYISAELRSIHNMAKFVTRHDDERDDSD